MGKDAKFWDKLAERYSRQPIANEEAYQNKLKVTREYFRPDSEVLEFGCGTGSTALLHAPHVKHVLATDFSANMLEIARRKAADQGIANVTFEQATIEDFEAADASFDAILTLSLLHLLEDKEAAIAKIRRLLKPGGVFVSSTVCIGDKMPYFKLIAPIGKALGLMPLLRIFKKNELLENIKAAGFDIDHEWQPEKGISVFVVTKKQG